jgi:hypothetical protein
MPKTRKCFYQKRLFEQEIKKKKSFQEHLKIYKTNSMRNKLQKYLKKYSSNSG